MAIVLARCHFMFPLLPHTQKEMVSVPWAYSALMGSFLIQTHHLRGCRCMDLDGLLGHVVLHEVHE